MERSSNERVRGPPGVNIPDGFGGVTAPGSKSLALVENISRSHGGGWENLWDRDVFWGELGGTSESVKQGVRNPTENVGAPTSVEDIWSGMASVETDHVARVGAATARKDYWPDTDVHWVYLARDQRLLEKFGRGPCRFRIFGSGLISVEDVDSPIEVPGRDMPCGYVGSR